MNRRITPNPGLISNQNPSPLCSTCLWKLGLHLTMPFPFVLGKCAEGCCPRRPSPETPSCRPSRKGPAAGQGNRRPLLTGHWEGGWGRRRGVTHCSPPKGGWPGPWVPPLIFHHVATARSTWEMSRLLSARYPYLDVYSVTSGPEQNFPCPVPKPLPLLVFSSQ